MIKVDEDGIKIKGTPWQLLTEVEFALREIRTGLIERFGEKLADDTLDFMLGNVKLPEDKLKAQSDAAVQDLGRLAKIFNVIMEDIHHDND